MLSVFPIDLWHSRLRLVDASANCDSTVICIFWDLIKMLFRNKKGIFFNKNCTFISGV